MKVKSVERIKVSEPIQLYDLQNTRHNNFIIQGKECDYVAHNCGLMDEVSFGIGMDIKKESMKMMDTYNAIKARMKSRFIAYGGNFPAVLFMVSSKKSELDFLETYIKKVKNDNDTLIVDEPIWKVKPEGTYCGKTFKISVCSADADFDGIVTYQWSEEEITKFMKKGGYFVDVPIEYYSDFDKDFNKALMDLAGISSSGTRKYIDHRKYKESVERLKATQPSRKNPFKRNILKIGLDDDYEISDFFDDEKVPYEDKHKPVYLHIDSALKGDRTGISAVSIRGAATIANRRYADDANKEEAEVVELVYNHLFTVGIEAPKDSEISLGKTRRFIYYLKSKGWNIKGVSLDGFQSADTRQILLQKGYNCEIRSLDRTTVGYDTFRSSIYDKRIDTLDIPELEEEAINLEKENGKDKVDHPKDGSKDLVDSYAGALWFASTQTKSYVEANGADLDVMVAVSTGFTSEKEQLIKTMSDSLANDANGRETARKVVERYQKEQGTVDVSNMTDEEMEAYKKSILKDNDYVDTSGVGDGIIVF